MSFHTPWNSVTIRVTAPRSSGGSSIAVDTSVPAGLAYPGTLTVVRGGVAVAILEITNWVGLLLTCTGAVDGTTDLDLIAGDTLESRPCRLYETEVRTAITTLQAIAPINVQVSGDSITAGFGLSSPSTQSWPAQMGALLGAKWSVVNQGISGDTIAQCTTAAATTVVPAWSPRAPLNISFLFAGSNDAYYDLIASMSPSVIVAAIQADTLAFHAAMHAAGYPTADCTMLPRTVNGTWEGIRQTINTWKRAFWATYADDLCDFALQASMGFPGDDTNLTYYQDGAHPTAAGAALLAPIAVASALRIANVAYARVAGANTFGGAVTAPQVLTTGSNAGYYVTRRDNSVPAFQIYSTAGTFEVYSFVAMSDVFAMDSAGNVAAASFGGSGAGLTALNATNLTSGTVPTLRLGSGTADSTHFLRGDQSWAVPAGGGSSVGASGAIQAGNGSGGFSDSGLTTATIATHAYVTGLGYATTASLGTAAFQSTSAFDAAGAAAAVTRTTLGAAQSLTRTLKTGAYTAQAGDQVSTDSTSGNVPILLVTAPATKSLINVKQVIRGGTNVTTVTCGGSDVFNYAGGPTVLTLTLAGQGANLAYDAAGIWTVTADDLPLGQLDARYVQGSGGGATTLSSLIAWEACYDADQITPQADNTDLTAWLDSGLNARTQTASAVGAASYRTAGSGVALNGHAIVRLSGSGYLRSTLGGAALSGDFWSIAVVRMESVASDQEMINWGSTAGGGRRASIFYTSSSSWGFNDAAVAIGNDVIANNAWHVLELIKSGTTITGYRDGTQVFTGTESGAISYSPTAVTLGANASNGEKAQIDFAFVGLNGSIPTPSQRALVLGALAARTGLSISGLTITAMQPLPYFSGSGVVAASGISRATSGGVECYVIGAGSPILVADSDAPPFHQVPMLSVNGAFAASATGTGNMHSFFGNAFNSNVATIWNQSFNSFSAMTFRAPGTGHELGAFGSCQNMFPWGGPNGSMFLECSNFSDSSKWGDLRFDQAITTGPQICLRFRTRDDTNAIEEYDLTATEPSVGGPTTGLVCLRAKPVKSVANNGTLNTNITTGATHCGLVIVKDATNSTCGMWRLENATLTAVSVNAEFTTTSGNASTVNIFNSSGQLVIENKTGGTLNLTAAYYGA